MIEFLFLVGLIIFVYLLMPKPKKTDVAVNPNAADKVQLDIDAKVCPPHQWFAQEVVDKNGERIGWRTVCKLCGPLGSD